MRIKKADILLVLVLLAAAALAAFLMLTLRDEGGRAVVIQDGQEILSLPLDQDAEEVIETEGQTNTVVIRNGAASVTEANCPDKVCVHTGEIRYESQTIVCLPHKLVVKIEGGEAPEADVVSQ